jgi:hypothetical protein
MGKGQKLGIIVVLIVVGFYIYTLLPGPGLVSSPIVFEDGYSELVSLVEQNLASNEESSELLENTKSALADYAGKLNEYPKTDDVKALLLLTEYYAAYTESIVLSDSLLEQNRELILSGLEAPCEYVAEAKERAETAALAVEASKNVSEKSVLFVDTYPEKAASIDFQSAVTDFEEMEINRDRLALAAQTLKGECES